MSRLQYEWSISVDLLWLTLSNISTEAEEEASVEKIIHFNDNVENSSEEALPEEYDTDSGTNSDADIHKSNGMFDLSGLGVVTDYINAALRI